MSHLLQMRGLKLFVPLQSVYLSMSHLLQMRGLKPPIVPNINIGNWVASFTDAWIETKDLFNAYKIERSHLLQMRGLKPKEAYSERVAIEVASFTDAWIETLMYANWQSDA